MSKVTINILTQLTENYGTAAVPYWKAKFGPNFTVKVDSDILLYSDKDETVKAIKTMLAEVSNNHEKFEYISHDVEFQKSIVLDEEKFKNMINQQWQKCG
jgi:hypothetical protein